MFSLISECADHLVEYIEKLASRNEPVECLELMAQYTTDVIGNCAFGIDMNTLSNKDSEFRRIGRDIFHQPSSDLLRSIIKTVSPRLYDILGYILPDTEITNFFMDLVMDSIDNREKNNIVRHDFIDMLRELKKHPDKMEDIGKCLPLLLFFFAARKFLYRRTIFELTISVIIQNIIS
jgi:cytochrome P450 family 6